jgi:hypothetical protein
MFFGHLVPFQINRFDNIMLLIPQSTRRPTKERDSLLVNNRNAHMACGITLLKINFSISPAASLPKTNCGLSSRSISLWLQFCAMPLIIMCPVFFFLAAERQVEWITFQATRRLRKQGSDRGTRRWEMFRISSALRGYKPVPNQYSSGHPNGNRSHL